jgi:hypothetical protein
MADPACRLGADIFGLNFLFRPRQRSLAPDKSLLPANPLWWFEVSRQTTLCRFLLRLGPEGLPKLFNLVVEQGRGKGLVLDHLRLPPPSVMVR